MRFTLIVLVFVLLGTAQSACEDSKDADFCQKISWICTSTYTEWSAAAKAACQKTCGLCDESGCTDAKGTTYCTNYSWICTTGCSYWKGIAKEGCQKTCGFCKASDVEEDKAEEAVECTDAKGTAYCAGKTWICKTGCPYWKGIAKEGCQKTCGFCTAGDKTEEKEEEEEEEEEKEESSDDLNQADFQAAILKAHNDYRAKHSTGAMTWSKAAQDFAQEWCDKLAKEDKMYHSTYPERDNMGENLYMQSWAPDADIGANTVKSWYDEESLWDYSKDAYQSGAGHFTQVVWKGSTEVGCAYAYKSSTFVCCNYNPAGNSGAYKANVGTKD